MAKGRKYDPAQPGLASSVAARHFSEALMQAMRPGSVKGRLRGFMEALSRPVELTPAEARGVLYLVGLRRVDVDPDDEGSDHMERIRAVLTPMQTFTVEEIYRLFPDGPGASKPNIRRTLQELRDEGWIRQGNRRGEWQISVRARIEWPDTARYPEGWVITKDGKLFAI